MEVNHSILFASVYFKDFVLLSSFILMFLSVIYILLKIFQLRSHSGVSCCKSPQANQTYTSGPELSYSFSRCPVLEFQRGNYLLSLLLNFEWISSVHEGLLCYRLTGHRWMDLFLDFLSPFIDLYFYFCASNLLFWLL